MSATSSEDGSMDSTAMVPQQPEPTITSEPLNLIPSEYRSNELTPEFSASSIADRRSPTESQQIESEQVNSHRSQLETENLRIRSVDQLLNPESLKLQKHLRVTEGRSRDDRMNGGNMRLPGEALRSRTREGLLTVGIVPPELEVRERGEGVRAKKDIPKGTRYGPFLGKWLGEPIDPRFAWEVSYSFIISK